MNISLRSTSTEDIKITQKALESIGFKIIREGDNCEAYYIELKVPEKYQHITCVVWENDPFQTDGKKMRVIKT